MLTCSSPWLFAAYRVLRRQSVPWHPPCALIRLILPRDLPYSGRSLVMPALLRLLRGWHDPDSFRSECLPCAVFKVRAEREAFGFEGLGIRD